jgi:membrane-bound ClpP family serine protease
MTATARSVQVGLAAAALALVFWATALPSSYKWIALTVGAVLGVIPGGDAARRMERRVDRTGGIVLYVEDTFLHALLLPLAIVSLSPFALGTALRTVGQSADLQSVLQTVLCALAAMWLGHDVVVTRRLRRLEARFGQLQVRWFYAPSAVGAEAMLGKTGVVLSPCCPQGYVRIGSERWRAESLDGAPLNVGQQVVVRRLSGIVLSVELVETPASNRPL